MDSITAEADARELAAAYCPLEFDELSPKQRMIWQLAALTVIEGANRGYGPKETGQLWTQAIDRVTNLQWALIPSGAGRQNFETLRNYNFWERYSVQDALKYGDQSPAYYDVNRSEIEASAAQYLEFSWLAHPTIDFAIADALVTTEVCQFGEAVKNMPVGGLANTIILSIARERAKGNTDNLAFEILRARALGFFWIYVLPIGVLVFLWNHLKADWMLGLAIGWGTFYVLRVLYRGILSAWRRLFKIEIPYDKCLKLWTKMANVHRLLGNETLAPMVVKAEMDATRNEGAVWSQTIDVILARRAIASGGLWIVTPTLSGIIDDALRRRA